jgi:glutamyl-tRNA reductase
MTDAAGSIAAIVSHARNVPVAARERLADDLRKRLAEDRRGLVVETCHRVEGYAAGPESVAALADVSIPDGAQRLQGEAAIRHAITVAVGRDSVVVGEDQVLHQLREALDAARADGTLDPTLERLFNAALRAGRLARSWRTGPTRSLASVALAEIVARSGPLEDRPLLIVGAGKIARAAARAGAELGARITIANRTPAAAAELAHTVRGSVLPLDPGPTVAKYAGIVIGVSGPWTIEPATAEALVRRHCPVVDLSVPPSVPPGTAARLGTSLITADDLAHAEQPVDALDPREARRTDALIARTSEVFVAWLEARDRRAVAAALADRANAAREAELAELWRRLPTLDPESRGAIDAMARHLAERLLREPLDRLGRDVDGAAERAVREAFAL